jgi:hypothetical protein
MTILDSSDLAAVTGGASATQPQTFEQFASNLKGTIQSEYKTLVCNGAGYQGADQLATQVYGKNATDSDKIRASQMLTAYCNGGSQLPAAAPKLPF